jgi:superfamily I DNA/RNA helicase
VFLLWADLLPRYGEGHDPAEEVRLMYVGLTRPEDYLFITCSKLSGFISRIEKTGKVTAP